MSLRIDTAELITGAYVVGETGLGVLAESLPGSGLHGASYLFNDVTLPADAGKEIRGMVVTPPGAGTFFAWEDGSFTLTGAPDGVHTFTYRLVVDGVDMGTADATVTVGEIASGTQSGTATLDGVGAGGTLGSHGSVVLSGTGTVDGVSATGAMTSVGQSELSGSAGLDGVTAAGSISIEGVSSLAGSAALDGISASGALASHGPSDLSGGMTVDGIGAGGWFGDGTVIGRSLAIRLLPWLL